MLHNWSRRAKDCRLASMVVGSYSSLLHFRSIVIGLVMLLVLSLKLLYAKRSLSGCYVTILFSKIAFDFLNTENNKKYIYLI